MLVISEISERADLARHYVRSACVDRRKRNVSSQTSTPIQRDAAAQRVLGSSSPRRVCLRGQNGPLPVPTSVNVLTISLGRGNVENHVTLNLEAEAGRPWQQRERVVEAGKEPLIVAVLPRAWRGILSLPDLLPLPNCASVWPVQLAYNHLILLVSPLGLELRIT
jgi:hypothetical protein